VVYGREIDGTEVTFGTTGYTMNNIFVLYDRASESVWYPLSNTQLRATSGPKKGTAIEFMDKQVPMTLGAWRKLHPQTRVLLPK
jgi:hypothetical protein